MLKYQHNFRPGHIYDYDFDIVNLPFMDDDVRCRVISELFSFARVCNHVMDFNAQNKCLTAKPLSHV